MLSLDRIQNKLTPYYGSIGKYLERNGYLNTLYDFQILIKDYVRASMSSICFFSRHCQNYVDLFNNLNHLYKARKHLEEYLELKQFSQNSIKQNSLCKQISAQEVDKYMSFFFFLFLFNNGYTDIFFVEYSIFFDTYSNRLETMFLSKN